MLPLFKALVDFAENCVPVISLVDEPAIELDFEFFSSQVMFESFKSVDDLQGKIAGPVLIPDKRIYRVNPVNNEPYDLFFDKETVQGMADSFSQNLNNRNITIQHSGIAVPVTITESWITGKPDKSEGFGYDLPEGTWFVVAKVQDMNFFRDYVVAGKVKGFSIETKIKKQQIEMSKEQFASFPIKGSDAPLEADNLEVGTEASVSGQPAQDGEYQLEDGNLVVVKDGKIAEVTKQETKEEVEQADEPEAPAAEQNPDAVKELVEQIVGQRFSQLEERLTQIEDAIRAAQSKSDEAMSKVEEFGKTNPAAETKTAKMKDQLSSIEALRAGRK